MGPARLSLTGTLVPLVLGLGVAGASAQSNTITIEQTGIGNTLSVDQSEASNSTVGGLTITEGDPATYTDSGDPGITATVNPLVVTTNEVARQDGVGNSADITISHDGGRAYLDQDTGSGAGLSGGAIGNIATIGLSADAATAVLGQAGLGNEAHINVTGDLGSSGTILQKGNDNNASLLVEGSRNAGFISQNGDNNDTGLVRVGGVDTSVTYIQQGSNLAPVTPGSGVSVISNAASVTITQSSFAGAGGN